MKGQNWPDGTQDNDSWAPARNKQDPGQLRRTLAELTIWWHQALWKAGGKQRKDVKRPIRPSQILTLCPHSQAATLIGDGLILWYNWTRKAQELGTPGTGVEGQDMVKTESNSESTTWIPAILPPDSKATLHRCHHLTAFRQEIRVRIRLPQIGSPACKS